MDCKKGSSQDKREAAGVRVMGVIKEWKPDYIIVSDDCAAKYVVVRHMPIAEVPVVFCGVNWDAGKYGFPRHNVTGMVEVFWMENLIGSLLPYAKGDRVRILGTAASAVYEAVSQVKERSGGDVIGHVVEDFAQWKKKFIELQQTGDILLLSSSVIFADDWDPVAARTFILKHTRVPTGGVSKAMAPYVLVSMVKRPEEQGEFAARAVLRLMNGETTADIPVTRNKVNRVYLNMKLAKSLGIIFPMNLIDQSVFVSD